jgi:UDP-2,4-diacetamido-2,4,6-trideoxy-beta-L-altropyranose hydrolase
MKRNIVFRLDCGKIIGSGHLMRCLAFARVFKRLNYKCFFVTYDFSKDIIEKVIKKEFKIFYLNSIKYKKNPIEFEKLVFNHKKNLYSSKEKHDFFNIVEKKIKNVETIIVDHYGLSYDWEKFVKKKLKKKLVIIDDFLNRNHFCDILIDPTGQYIENKNDKIDKIFSGLKYVVINKNFYRQNIKKKNFIFISFGSMDKLQMSLKTVKELINMKLKFKIVVAISKFSKNYSKLLEYQNKKQIVICNEVKDLNYFLNRSIFAIGAAGTSAFERIHLKIPSLVFKTASNQKNVLKNLSNINCVKIGNKKKIKESIIHFLNLKKSFNFSNVVDTFGAERVIPSIIKNKNKLKFEFFKNDIEQRDALFLMRNMSQHFSTSKITNTKIFYNVHNKWCNLIENNNTDLIYLIIYENVTIGYIRYHLQKNIRKNINSLEISIFVQDDLSNKSFGSFSLNFFNSLFQDQHITAEISKNNTSSLNFFKKNNFSFKNNEKKIKLF